MLVITSYKMEVSVQETMQGPLYPWNVYCTVLHSTATPPSRRQNRSRPALVYRVPNAPPSVLVYNRDGEQLQPAPFLRDPSTSYDPPPPYELVAGQQNQAFTGDAQVENPPNLNTATQPTMSTSTTNTGVTQVRSTEEGEFRGCVCTVRNVWYWQSGRATSATVM